jgi:hypothetical protein
MRTVALAIVFILLLGFKSPSYAGRGVGSIELSANPSTLPADGKSISIISVQVRDKEGKLVTDDTEIRFSTSLGVIEETALTSSGVARVKLVSSDVPGTAVITATWISGQAVAQLNVTFGDAPAAPQGPNYIDVDADGYLAYSIDYKVIEALGNVRIRYRALDIEADAAQVDLKKNWIIARGGGRDNPVKIRTSAGVIDGDVFACDLDGIRGFIISAGRAEVCQVDLSKPVPEVGSGGVDYTPDIFDFTDLSDSSVLVKASAATVFPNEKIHF